MGRRRLWCSQAERPSAAAREKKDKAFTVQVIANRMGLNDQTTQNAIFDFFTQDKVTPTLPYPKPELFTLPINQLATKNQKAKGYDVTKLLDPSLVQSAADRHLDK